MTIYHTIGKTMLTQVARFALVSIAFFLLVATASAQEPWTWPEKPENLQVLPNDWPGTRLRPVMTGFTRALGVRCSHCHIGEEGQPLSTYDFVSDDNPNKERAREMMQMLGSINDHLQKLEPSGDQRINMWCHTCHRGRPRPMTLEEEMGESYRAGGVEAALVTYEALKENFYGRGAYDFGERALNLFGYEVMEDAPEQAISIFQLNADSFPESANVWDSLAEAYMKAGDNDKAREYYRKSLELNPNNQNASEMLKQLGEEN